MGCGTGSHARFFQKDSLFFLGVDLSFDFIKHSSLKNKGSNDMYFITADMNNLPLKESKFDLIFTLFHVMNFLSVDQLENLLGRLSKLLNGGGLLIFDYRQEVDNENSNYKVKNLSVENSSYRVNRVSEIKHLLKSQIDIHHKFSIIDKNNKKVLTFSENHKLHNLDYQELVLIGQKFFSEIVAKDFITGLPPTKDSRSIIFRMSNSAI